MYTICTQRVSRGTAAAGGGGGEGRHQGEQEEVGRMLRKRIHVCHMRGENAEANDEAEEEGFKV
jgi:hypothetical protein